MTLGDLITMLKAFPPDRKVKFDFCGCSPTSLASYRGYYDQLAVGWTAEWTDTTAEMFLRDLQAAVGKTFAGWKGGEYKMDAETEVWVDNPGDCNSTKIVGIELLDGFVTLKTAYIEHQF